MEDAWWFPRKCRISCGYGGIKATNLTNLSLQGWEAESCWVGQMALHALHHSSIKGWAEKLASIWFLFLWMFPGGEIGIGHLHQYNWQGPPGCKFILTFSGSRFAAWTCYVVSFAVSALDALTLNSSQPRPFERHLLSSDFAGRAQTFICKWCLNLFTRQFLMAFQEKRLGWPPDHDG